MINFSPLALKLSEEIEDEEGTYFKIAKFLITPYRDRLTKSVLLIFAKLQMGHGTEARGQLICS